MKFIKTKNLPNDGGWRLSRTRFELFFVTLTGSVFEWLLAACCFVSDNWGSELAAELTMFFCVRVTRPLLIVDIGTAGSLVALLLLLLLL